MIVWQAAPTDGVPNEALKPGVFPGPLCRCLTQKGQILNTIDHYGATRRILEASDELI
jgi:hypothetical protein